MYLFTRNKVLNSAVPSRLHPLTFPFRILNLHLHSLHDCDCKDRSREKQFGFYVHINLTVPFHMISKFRELSFPTMLKVFFAFHPLYISDKTFCGITTLGVTYFMLCSIFEPGKTSPQNCFCRKKILFVGYLGMEKSLVSSFYIQFRRL